MHPLKQFFIFCSGADKNILADKELSHELNKYLSIGATIFFTGIFAAIASGYALFRIFYAEEFAGLYAFSFGLLWGLMIFNLDRYIVSSMRKTDSVRNEFFTAFPRFIIAVIISLVIAKPLEVRIFSDRIASELDMYRIETINKKKNKIQENYDLDGKKTDAKTASDDFNEAFNNKNSEPGDKEYLDLKRNYKNCNSRLSRKKRINYPRIKAIKERITEIERDPANYRIVDDIKEFYIGADENLVKLQKERTRLNREIYSISKECKAIFGNLDKRKNDHQNYWSDEADKLKIAKDEKEKNLKKSESDAEKEIDNSSAATNRGLNENFIAQIESLGRLTKWEEDKLDSEGNIIEEADNTMWWASILIMLLFIVVESAPVIVKLLSKRGTYDEKLIAKEKLIKESTQDDVEAQVKLNKAQNENVLQIDLSSNKTLLDKISSAQIEIAEKVVQSWKLEELKKLGISQNGQQRKTTNQPSS